MSAAITSAVVGGVSLIAGMDGARSAGNKQEDALRQQKEQADRSAKLAEDQWNRYLDVYGPLEDEVVSEARNLGSEANKTKAAQEAAGTVVSSYDNLRAKLAATPGLDPSSQKYLDTVSKIGLKEAADSAAAQTGARRQTEADGRTAMANAAALGKGLPASATSAAYGASAAAGQVASGANANLAQANANVGGAARMFGDAISKPGLGDKIGGLFSSAPQGTPGAYINTDPSSLMAQNGSDVGIRW